MLLIPDKLERDIGFYLVKIQHPRSSTCNILICIKIVACIFEVIAFPGEQKQFDYQHWNFLGSLCKAHSKKFVGKRQIVWVKMSMTSLKFSWWTNKEKLFCFSFSRYTIYTNQYHQVMLHVSIFAAILKNSNSCCSKNFELSN